MAVRIKRCTVSRPGLFDNTAIEFSDGVNIIYGRNGSGKSLLARAMMDALWADTAGEGLLKDAAWESLHLEMLFALDHEKVYKTVKTRTGDSSFFCIENDSAAPCSRSRKKGKKGGTEDESPNETDLHCYFDKVDFTTFTQSSFMPSPSDIGPDSRLDFSVIKNIVLSDTSGFFDLYKKLDDIRADSPRGSALGKKLSGLEAKLKDITKEIKIFEIQNSKKDKLMAEKRNVQQEIDRMKVELSLLEDKKDTMEEIRKNLQKIERLNEELRSIKNEVDGEQEKIAAISRMKQEISDRFPEFSGIEPESGETLDRLQEIFIEIRNINEKIDSFHARKERQKKITRKAAVTIGTVYLTLLAALIYTGSVTIPESIRMIGTGSGALFALCLALVGYPYAAPGSKVLDALKENKRILGLKMKEYADQIQFHHGRDNLGELYEFLLQYFEDYIEYSDKNREIKELDRSLKDSAYLDKIQNKLKELKSQEETIKTIINSAAASLNINRLKNPDFTVLDELTDEIDSGIAGLNDSIAAKKNILVQIDSEILQHPDKTGHYKRLCEEKDEIQAVLNNLYARKNTLDYVIGLLSRTIEKSESRQLKKIVGLAHERFTLLTENQFVGQVDEESIRRFLTAPVEGLNPSLMHFIMLSLKLSLTDFLAEAGLSAPLILDDPFLFMDDEKIDNLRELVLDASEKRQVIIFTHKKNAADWGNYREL